HSVAHFSLCSFLPRYAALRVLHSFLHDALPISAAVAPVSRSIANTPEDVPLVMTMARFVKRKRIHLLIDAMAAVPDAYLWIAGRSEEHTSELQSRENLVCRLLLEKKKKKNSYR